MLTFLERLRKKLFHPAPRQKPARTPRFTKLYLEPLEDRLVLDAMSFTGGTLGTSTNWFDPLNWANLTNPGNLHVPNASDDAAIGAFTVVISGQNADVKSLVTTTGSS